MEALAARIPEFFQSDILNRRRIGYSDQELCQLLQQEAWGGLSEEEALAWLQQLPDKSRPGLHPFAGHREGGAWPAPSSRPTGQRGLLSPSARQARPTRMQETETDRPASALVLAGLLATSFCSPERAAPALNGLAVRPRRCKRPSTAGCSVRRLLHAAPTQPVATDAGPDPPVLVRTNWSTGILSQNMADS
eukprot:g47871.t1